MVSLSLLLLKPDATGDTTDESVSPLLLLCRMADLAVGSCEGMVKLSLIPPLFLRAGLVSEGRGGKVGRSDGLRFSEVT